MSGGEEIVEKARRERVVNDFALKLEAPGAGDELSEALATLARLLPAGATVMCKIVEPAPRVTLARSVVEGVKPGSPLPPGLAAQVPCDWLFVSRTSAQILHQINAPETA
jgi:hypothetical protein